MSGKINTLPNGNRYVLDSFAIIGFLQNEPFSDQIESLLRQAQKGRAVLFFHCIHLGEVYYITLREKGQQLADLAYDRIKALPVTIIEHIEERLLKRACFFKAMFPISYADSFAAALAEISHCQLLTGDPEFKQLENKDIIRIAWLDSENPPNEPGKSLRKKSPKQISHNNSK